MNIYNIGIACKGIFTNKFSQFNENALCQIKILFISSAYSGRYNREWQIRKRKKKSRRNIYFLELKKEYAKFRDY